MKKQAAVDALRTVLVGCSDRDAQAVADILRLGAGDLGLPEGAVLCDPEWLPPARRHAYLVLREVVDSRSEGEEFFPRTGGWEHVLLALLVEHDWAGIHRAAAELREEHAKQVIRQVVDILDSSRHAFRSKQIQHARELLETLL